MGRLIAGGLRRSTVMAAVSAVWLAQAAPAAALLGWSQSPDSSTGQVGQAQAYALRVSNDNLLALLGIDDIGCVQVDVGTEFIIESVSVVGGPGGDWFGSSSGSTATVRSDSGGSRLGVGESVTFSVTAVPLSSGSLTWTTRVIRDKDCDGSFIPGTEHLTIQVTSPPAPTPTSSATPTPTPSPLLPVPLPSTPPPSVSLPSISLPSIGLVPTARPSASAHAPAASTKARETLPASASPDSAARAGGPADVGPSPSPAAAASARLAAEGGTGSAVDVLPVGASAAVASGLHAEAVGDGADVVLGQIGLVGGVTIWVVPAAVLGVPGVLVIVWVTLQAVGVLAWVPALRRLGGEPRGPRTG